MNSNGRDIAGAGASGGAGGTNGFRDTPTMWNVPSETCDDVTRGADREVPICTDMYGEGFIKDMEKHEAEEPAEEQRSEEVTGQEADEAVRSQSGQPSDYGFVYKA